MLYFDGTQWKKGVMSRCCRSIQTAPTMALTSDFRDEPHGFWALGEGRQVGGSG